MTEPNIVSNVKIVPPIGEDRSFNFLVNLINSMIRHPASIDKWRTATLSGLSQYLQCSGWGWNRRPIVKSSRTRGEEFLKGGVAKQVDLESLLVPYQSRKVPALDFLVKRLSRIKSQSPYFECIFVADQLTPHAEIRLMAEEESIHSSEEKIIYTFSKALPRNGVSFIWFLGSRAAITHQHERIKEIRNFLWGFDWLHLEGWELDDEGVMLQGLSPRLREVCRCLSQGKSRKEIAIDMGISMNTLHSYVKEVYKTLSVNSHAELMRLFHSNLGLRTLLQQE